MHRSLVLYLPPEDPQAFREYYESTHIPLFKRALNALVGRPTSERATRRSGRRYASTPGLPSLGG